jgi:hypothetical protein
MVTFTMLMSSWGTCKAKRLYEVLVRDVTQREASLEPSAFSIISPEIKCA